MVLSIICLSPGSVTTATGRGQVTEVKVLEGGDDWQCASTEERQCATTEDREGAKNEIHLLWRIEKEQEMKIHIKLLTLQF